ncbi:ABC transporter permease [Corynebacterium frankenforstense]
MNFSEAVTLAVTSLRTNKMRSVLTLLGVVVGIAAVVAILTLGRSLQVQTMDSLDDVGVNDVTVVVQPRDMDEENGAWAAGPVPARDRITPDMVDDLRTRFEGRVAGVAVEGQTTSGVEVTRGFSRGKADVRTANQDVMPLTKMVAVVGRLLTAEDVAGRRPVAVVPEQTVDELFGGDAHAALGQELRLRNKGAETTVVVVGVYESQARSGLLVGDDSGPNPQIYLPLGADQELAAGGAGAGGGARAGAAGSGQGAEDATEGYSEIRVRAVEGEDTKALGRDVQTWADGFYRDNTDNHAKVLDLQQDLDALNQLFSTMSIVLSAIGGIALLVGGIGVMNIMLVTVTERTREIGVRKALGARRRDIRIQFVVEAMIVCFFGGLLGVVIGGVAGMAGSAALGTFVLPPLSGVAVSLLFALGVGLFFGYYPAGKAARLDPIDALRYE